MNVCGDSLSYITYIISIYCKL